MAHIKIINGKKYYYESVRNGKKVMSKYIGPVNRIRKQKEKTEKTKKENEEEIAEKEDTYIG